MDIDHVEDEPRDSDWLIGYEHALCDMHTELLYWQYLETRARPHR